MKGKALTLAVLLAFGLATLPSYAMDDPACSDELPWTRQVVGSGNTLDAAWEIYWADYGAEKAACECGAGSLSQDLDPISNDFNPTVSEETTFLAEFTMDGELFVVEITSFSVFSTVTCDAASETSAAARHTGSR